MKTNKDSWALSAEGPRGTAMGAEPPPAAGVHHPAAVWPRFLATVAGLRLPARVAATGRGAS